MKNFLFLVLVTFSLTHCSPTKKYAASVQHWEKDMQKFDSLNAVNDYADNAILFGKDNTHQNPEGYQLWTEAIKKKVKEVL